MAGGPAERSLTVKRGDSMKGVGEEERVRHSSTSRVLMSSEQRWQTGSAGSPRCFGSKMFSSDCASNAACDFPETCSGGCSARFWGVWQSLSCRTGRRRCEADYYVTSDLFIYRRVFLFSLHLCCLFLHRGFLWLWQAGAGLKSSNSQWGLWLFSMLRTLSICHHPGQSKCVLLFKCGAGQQWTTAQHILSRLFSWITQHLSSTGLMIRFNHRL